MKTMNELEKHELENKYRKHLRAYNDDDNQVDMDARVLITPDGAWVHRWTWVDKGAAEDE